MSFSNKLTDDHLLIHVAAFLAPKDLLSFQCVSKNLAKLDTSQLWHNLCKQRWEPWPRYRLTDERVREMSSEEQDFLDSSWKQRYLRVEREATRITLKMEDLIHLDWYLSFSLTGVRGDLRTPLESVQFSPSGTLHVPGYPALDYEIIQDAPPAVQLPQSLHGDRPFSQRQWLRISNFPPHYITRKASDANWMIVNENVVFLSSSRQPASTSSSST